MAIVTLQQLDDRVRERADQVYASTITTSEIYTYINDAKRYVDDLIVRCYGDDYRATSVTFTATVGTENHSLSVLTSGTFYKLLQLSATGASSWQDCRPYNWKDRNSLRRAGVVLEPGEVYRYKITGDNLSLLPLPTAATRMEIVWIPQTTALSLSSDSYDDVNGYSKLVVLKAVLAIKDKLEEDASIVMAEIASEEARITSSAPNRDAGEPLSVADVQDGQPYSSWPLRWTR